MMLVAGITSLLISALAEPLLDTERLDMEQLDSPSDAPTEVVPVDSTAEDELIENESIEEESENREMEAPRPSAPLRPSTACPSDLETLSQLLIRDIPNYTNRVLQRSVAVIPKYDRSDSTESSGQLIQEGRRPSYIIIAGRPELEPLDLSEYAITTDPAAGGQIEQLFFTTLARQYSNNRLSGVRANEVQSYHWLFLAEASDGWWLAFMYSQIDDPDTPRAPTPPRESSTSAVGQAVQIWLRDCRAGDIRPIEAESSSRRPAI